MPQAQTLTIINNQNLRGVIAPAAMISKERLEDIIDLIELSDSQVSRETDDMIKRADRDNSWLGLDEVKGLSDQIN